MRSFHSILDAVLKALEKFGGIIKNKQRETKVCVGREEVKIGIKEKRKQMLHEKTKEELKSEARSGYSWAPKFDYIQTGYLHFLLMNGTRHVKVGMILKIRKLNKASVILL
jgi:hypothetical protein